MENYVRHPWTMCFLCGSLVCNRDVCPFGKWQWAIDEHDVTGDEAAMGHRQGGLVKTCCRQLCRYVYLHGDQKNKECELTPILRNEEDAAVTELLLGISYKSKAVGDKRPGDSATLPLPCIEDIVTAYKVFQKTIKPALKEKGVHWENYCRHHVCSENGIDQWITVSNTLWLLHVLPGVQLRTCMLPDQKTSTCSQPRPAFTVRGDTPLRKAFFKHSKHLDKSSLRTVYHGSSTSNWLCILRHGLRSMSKTRYMSTGAVHGDGIYVSSDVHTALGYATSWGTSGSASDKAKDIGHIQNIRLVAECLLLPEPASVCDFSTCSVVKDPRLLLITRLLLF